MEEKTEEEGGCCISAASACFKSGRKKRMENRNEAEERKRYDESMFRQWPKNCLFCLCLFQ